jgi:hypothetical protein
MQAHFRHLSSKNFSMVWRTFQSNEFWPYNSLLKIQESIGSQTPSQNGSSLGSVGVHSLTFSYTLRGMKCDSRASLLACTFASPCFGNEPKVRVATLSLLALSTHLSHSYNYRNELEQYLSHALLTLVF